MGIFTEIFLVDLLGAVIALLVTVYAYYKWAFQYWTRRNVPQLGSSVPFGTFVKSWTRTVSIGEDIRSMYKEAKVKGYRHCGVYNMCRPYYLVMDLDVAKCIMTKDFNNFTRRDLYYNEKDPLTSNIFTIGGHKWKKLRGTMTPTFTSGKLKAMFPTFLDQSVILDNYFEEHVKLSNEPVDLKEVFACFSNDTIGSIAFGLECNSFKEPNSPFRAHAKKFLLKSNLLALRSMFNQNFPATARFLGLKEIREDVSAFFMKIVEDAVEYRERHNCRRNDFLQLLIDLRKAENYLTMDVLAAQCFVFWLAGFETSATTMSYASYLLATHLDIQQKTREEILTVLDKHDGRITYDSLLEMKYLSQVIEETLRMYSAVPLVTRKAEEDYRIRGEDVVIEAGTSVLIPILGYHGDKDYFPDPDTFDPDRFSEENKKSRHPYAYLPFGAGPRICVGEKFGLLQTKLGLVILLRKFLMTLNKKTLLPLNTDPTSFIPVPVGGVWINIENLPS